MKRLLTLLILLFVSASFTFAADFGFIFDNNIDIENNYDEDIFAYTPGIVTWFSYKNNSGFSIYLSGYFSFQIINGRDHTKDADFNDSNFIPELTLFALNYKFNNVLSLEAGRIGYVDTLGFTASGLFDGLRFGMNLPFGNISASAFYTGLLYKDTAKIVMTGNDEKKYDTAWDFDNFNDYFASRRFLTVIRGDIHAGYVDLGAEVLVQFDLNDGNEKLNSQYFMLLASFYPINMMKISAGGLFSSMQGTDITGKNDTGFAFGGLAQVKIDLPTAINDQFGVNIKFTSGKEDDDLSTFKPINSHLQGIVLTGSSLSGLASIGLNYDVRLNKTMYTEAVIHYFIKTFNDILGDGNLLGGEIGGKFTWQPFDDLQTSLGGGVFLPSLGNYYSNDADPMWKVSISIKLAL